MITKVNSERQIEELLDADGEGYQKKPDPFKKPTLHLAVTKKRRPWFEGLWSNAKEPVERAYHL